MSVYHPSGSSGEERQAFKIKWLSDFDAYIKTLKLTRPKLIMAGDYNICHKEIDIHNPKSNSKTSGFCLKKGRGWKNLFRAGILIVLGILTKSPINTAGGATVLGQGQKIWAGELTTTLQPKTSTNN